MAGSSPAVLGHQVADSADVILLSCVPGKAIGPGDAAPQTAMNDHQSLSRPMVHPLGPHHGPAIRCTIAWLDIDML
jgi:hypothetical protein